MLPAGAGRTRRQDLRDTDGRRRMKKEERGTGEQGRQNVLRVWHGGRRL